MTASSLQDQIRQRVGDTAGRHYRRAINATGIILHTALGRAVLPHAAIRQIQEELSGYSIVQIDVTTGRRAKRDARIEWLLQRLIVVKSLVTILAVQEGA